MKQETLFSENDLKKLPVNYRLMRKELKERNHEIDNNFRFSVSKIHRTKRYGYYPSLFPSIIEKFILKDKDVRL